MLRDINQEHINYTPALMFSDSNSYIQLAGNPFHHPRSKHIDIRHHHICDHINTDIIFKYVPGENNLADTFTKALGRILFVKYSNILKGYKNI